MAAKAKITVLFFGVLTEVCGASSVEMEAADMDSLRASLNRDYPGISAHSFRYSINQEFVQGNSDLSDGDEVALLPPFAGG